VRAIACQLHLFVYIRCPRLRHPSQQLQQGPSPLQSLEDCRAHHSQKHRGDQLLPTERARGGFGGTAEHYRPVRIVHAKLTYLLFLEQQRTTLPYSKAYIVVETSAAPILDGTERSGIAQIRQQELAWFPDRGRGVVQILSEAPKTIKARSARANVMLSDQRWHEANELVKAFRAIVAEKQRLCHDRRGPRGNGLCRLEIHIMAFLRTSG
jgi:hypothetical protein